MKFARTFSAIALAASIAGCSGNLGSGESTLPGTPGGPGGMQNGSSIQQVAQAAPSASPVSAANVASLGGTAGAQPLPAIAGWSGTIAFPAPASSAAPKSSPFPGDPSASIGISSSVVEPTDAPVFGAVKKHAKHTGASPVALFFISLLATSNVTLPTYPRIIIDVPRDIAAKHQNDVFALALYDAGQKDKTFQLEAAARDTSVAAADLPSPLPTPVPSPTATAFGASTLGTLTPPPVGQGLTTSSLPPQPMAFVATAAALNLKENVPLIFALYVVPPSPAPSSSPAAGVSPAPAWSWGPAAQPLPTASGVPAAAVSSAPTGGPSGTPLPR